MIHPFAWDDTSETRLRVLWSEGESASIVAGILCSEFGGKLTRCAVIGKVHRLKLPGRMTRRTTRAARVPRAPRVPKVKKERAPKPPRIKLAPVPKPEPVVVLPIDPWEPLPGTVPVQLVDLEHGDCRWPVGGDAVTAGNGFCGCSVQNGKSYCPEHYALSVGRGTPSERNAVRDGANAARMAA